MAITNPTVILDIIREKQQKKTPIKSRTSGKYFGLADYFILFLILRLTEISSQA
jgi:hypothetical protein